MCLPNAKAVYKVEREWEHAGLLCAVVQVKEKQFRCGYVRVPPKHPFHGKGYDDVNVDVHGGLTFAKIEPCEHEDGTGWWFGFDCAHAGDATYDAANPPDHMVLLENLRFLETFHEHYWTHEEVVFETERLASQLAMA